ncbi:helicase HerA domain-containing protein [Funiculus sociatus]|uniref:helicase HerA domain-containing protein n=1 Tax=Funiculus sociatus TaxID=450527 RepID=UPI00329A40A1
MNPKLMMLSAFGLGILGASIATAGHFDGRLIYCQPSPTGCAERSVPDWVRLNVPAENVRREPGAAGWKLSGAFLAVAGFGAAMNLARSLANQEAKAQKYQNIWEGVNLEKLRIQSQAELEAFNQQAMIQAAELSYAVLEPYDQPLLDGRDSLDVSNQIEATAVSEPQTETDPKFTPWLKSFLSSTALVWGNQGSGKSWFVRLLAQKKVEAGYKVIVFDPNSNAREWEGVELYNTYEDIEGAMASYVGEVMGRYEEFGRSDISEEEWRARLWKDGKAITIIAEEATTYADFISDKDLLSKFAKVSATLSRKQEMPVTFVAHNNTQTCLGDIKGLANLIARMQQIQLLATTDPSTSQPVASGKALIRLDGSTEWMEVSTPKIERKITNFKVGKESDHADKPNDLDIQRELLNQAWQMPAAEPEPLNQPEQETSSSSDERFTPLELPREKAIKLIKQMRTELNQTQVIESLWEVTKGGSVGWKKAYAEFKELIGDGDEQS